MKAIPCLAMPCLIMATLIATPAIAADTVVYNSTPINGWYFGSGNDYAPANTATLTTDAGSQLALRFHQTFVAAPASDGAGVYNFALGTDPLSFDWSFFNATSSRVLTGLLTLTNVGTGQTFSYDPFSLPDNEKLLGSTQNSFRFNWAGIGFDPNADNTYRVDLSVPGATQSTLSIFANIGAGVPEPSTWAMMLVGFGLIGAGLRRRQRVAVRYDFA